MTEAPFASLPFSDLLQRFGDPGDAPSGGAGAALGGALGASLVTMLARASEASPALAQHHPLLRAVAEGCEEAGERLLRLADDDARAYAEVIRLRKQPEDDPARAAALSAALQAATDVPLQVMEQLLEVIGYAKNAIEVGLPAVAPDGATGAELCRAALKSAAVLVRANLGGVDDEAYVKLARTRMDEMAYMGTRVCTSIESFVGDLVK